MDDFAADCSSVLPRRHGKVPEGRESEGEGRLSWLVQSNWAEERSVSLDQAHVMVLVLGFHQVSTNGKRNLICRTLTGVTRQVGPRFENLVPALAYHFCLQLAYKILPASAQYFGVPCTLLRQDIEKVAHLNVIVNQFLPQ